MQKFATEKKKELIVSTNNHSKPSLISRENHTHILWLHELHTHTCQQHGSSSSSSSNIFLPNEVLLKIECSPRQKQTDHKFSTTTLIRVSRGIMFHKYILGMIESPN
jgi:hypothetical protein